MNQISKNLALWLVIFIMGFMLYSLVQRSQSEKSAPPSYSEFIKRVEDNQIKKVVIQGQELSFTDVENNQFKILYNNKIYFA